MTFTLHFATINTSSYMFFITTYVKFTLHFATINTQAEVSGGMF